MSKAKVENVYPLNFMQQALLFHSLQEQDDQGFLLVRCTLTGTLLPELFQKAWTKVQERHEVLRSSIHWENIEKPVQVVRPQADQAYQYVDWSQESPEAQAQKLEELQKQEREKRFDLNQAPISRIFTIKTQEQCHLILWSCHHILLDGWSSAIVLKDLVQFYEILQAGSDSKRLAPLPKYQTYLNWQKSQNPEEARAFWEDAMLGFREPTVLAQDSSLAHASESSYDYESFTLQESETQSLEALARSYRVTTSTLIQGLWSLLLCAYAKREDIMFGTTVSGRSGSIPEADSMAGMFVNLLPVRVVLEENQDLTQFFQTLQTRQSKALQFDYISLNQILDWNQRSSSSILFDSLVIFENFPLQDLKGGGLEIKDFQSGMTSTYPLTLAIRPESRMHFSIKYNTRQITLERIQWFLNNLNNLLRFLTLNVGTNTHALRDMISAPAFSQDVLPQNGKKNKKVKAANPESEFLAPRNELELKLARIWEMMFNRHPISIRDNFFEIGGRSLMAVQMFARIKIELNRNIPPITLLKYPTIESLAQYMSEEEDDKPWSALVPLRVNGDKPPIFCLHGGGSHVFFYRGLAQHLGPEQPVYALQSTATHGVNIPPQSIEQMATQYLAEIRKVQPHGPYHLMGYCFSNSICMEMAHMLDQMGEKVSLLAIIDSAPDYLTVRTNKDKFLRAIDIMRRLDFAALYSKLKWKIIRPLKRLSDSVLTPEQHKRNMQMVEPLPADLIKQYKWKPYHAAKITLIRSSHFHESHEHNFVIPAWQSLAKGGLDVHVIKGNHYTLFQEPDVIRLARQLSECLEEAQNEFA